MNKGLYLESFFSTKLDLDNPIVLPLEDLFFPIDLRFGFFRVDGNNDYFAFVATPEAMEKHQAILSGKKVILVGEDPLNDMINSIDLTIKRCRSKDCSSAFAELSQFYEWEFENYRVTKD